MTKIFKPEDFLNILIEPDPEQTFDDIDYTRRKHRKKLTKEEEKKNKKRVIKIKADKEYDIGV